MTLVLFGKDLVLEGSPTKIEDKRVPGIYSMYVCMYVCMYACMHVCMHLCMYACMHVCMHVCMHACMHAYLWISEPLLRVICDVVILIISAVTVKASNLNSNSPGNQLLPVFIRISSLRPGQQDHCCAEPQGDENFREPDQLRKP